MFEDLIALFGTITSTFSVHTKLMAVSNFFTSVGLMDNGAMTPGLGICPLKQEFGVLLC